MPASCQARELRDRCMERVNEHALLGMVRAKYQVVREARTKEMDQPSPSSPPLLLAG